MAAPTINIADPQGIWRPVYARRLALHATADTIVLAAWRRDLAGVNVAVAIAAWQAAVGEAAPAEEYRREAAAAAILAALAANTWTRTRAALALAAQRAHLTGWAAARAVLTRDRDDAGDYDEPDDTPGTAIASPLLSDAAAAATATSTLASILRATARRAGRAAATNTDPLGAARDALQAGYDAQLAADTAVSAAYGYGQLSAYMADGRQTVSLITAGDGRVCAACSDAEDNSPYTLLDAPRIPLHGRCRCTLAPP